MDHTPALRRTPWGAVVSLVLALLYGASPLDLIPDVIPLIGWLDDVVVVGLLLAIALASVARRRRQRARASALPVRD